MRGDTEVATSFARGLNTAASPVRFPRDAAALIQNARILPDGSVKRRDGTQRSHAAALNAGATIYGATTFKPSASAMQYVVVAGTNLYTSTDAVTWTQQATGLTAAYWSFCTMQVGSTAFLYMANGGTVRSWDGATFATVTGAPAASSHVATFNDRLYVSSGARLFASEIGAPTNFTIPDGLVLPITTHDGDLAITGLFQAAGVLFVFKRNSTAWVDGFGESTLVVAAGARGLSRSVGCVAFRSIAGFGDSGMIWLSERGLEYYVRGGEVMLLTEDVQDFMDTIDWASIEATPGIPSATVRASTQEYYCALPIGTSGATTNNRILVVRPPKGRRAPAFSVDILSVATLFAVADDSGVEQPWSGGYDGFVRELETGNVDDKLSDGSGGTAVTMTLRATPEIFGDIFTLKRGRTIIVHGVSDSDATVTVKLVADGTVGTGRTATLPAATNDVPTFVRKRVSGEGGVLHAQVETSAAVRITAVGLQAHRQRRTF